MKKSSFLLLLFLCCLFFLLPAEQIVIVNKTEFPLFEVYLALQDDSGWGEDLLPCDVIMPGGFAAVELDDPVSESLYKIRLTDEDGEIYSKRNINLSLRNKILIQSKDLLALSPEQELIFTLVNHTGDTITGLYISAETKDGWGENLIEGYFLNENEHVITLKPDPDASFYDIRFDMRENSYIQKHVFLAHRARIMLSLQ